MNTNTRKLPHSTSTSINRKSPAPIRASSPGRSRKCVSSPSQKRTEAVEDGPQRSQNALNANHLVPLISKTSIFGNCQSGSRTLAQSDCKSSCIGSPSSPVCRAWKRGPAEPAGNVINLSDRPSLCMSILGSEAAIGSSDHAVYTVDLEKQKFTRALHGKSYGHGEWVTCVDHTGDGRIISGGMDNKLCVWDKRGVRCSEMKGHSASISGVKVAKEASLAVSSSYDKTLMVWDIGKPLGRLVARLEGHHAAVMEFCMNSTGGSIVSGDRNGAVVLWDGLKGSSVLHFKNAHQGHITAMERMAAEGKGGCESSGAVYLTGGQDGILHGWDFRANGPICSIAVHVQAKGAAISCIGISQKAASGCPLVVTAGADKMMYVLDPRLSFKKLHKMQDHRDFIYSLHVSDSLVWSGGGDGSLLVHDVVAGNCLYGLGASASGSAVRCISLAGSDKQTLVATGDDGNVMIYSV